MMRRETLHRSGYGPFDIGSRLIDRVRSGAVCDFHLLHLIEAVEDGGVGSERNVPAVVGFAGIIRLLYPLDRGLDCGRRNTLRDIEQPGFDAECPLFDPDTLMRHEDHEDQLKDRPVTVLVHPLLEVAGTDEAKDYDQERVWAKGVVWLDSKVA